MRKSVFSLVILLFLTSAVLADDGVTRLSEPAHATEAFEDFGAMLPEGDTPQSLNEAISRIEELAGRSVLIQTEIQQVCQKKGCFFIARDGDSVARVRFVDYSFFIPTDSAGKTVTLAGTLERAQLTPEQAAHFAEDLGETPEAAPRADFEYQIMASAVRIPRA